MPQKIIFLNLEVTFVKISEVRSCLRLFSRRTYSDILARTEVGHAGNTNVLQDTTLPVPAGCSNVLRKKV